jgi:acyl-coenzyme A thioesterase PaaI-like protein
MIKLVKFNEHPDCFVCGQRNQGGLRLDFQLLPDGKVEAQLCCTNEFQGYPGYLHGGIIASLLDGAMTNCLFAHGKIAMTAELKIRYFSPIVVEKKLTIRSWIEKSRPRFFLMKAEIISEGILLAQGNGKFMEKPQISRRG